MQSARQKGHITDIHLIQEGPFNVTTAVNGRAPQCLKAARRKVKPSRSTSDTTINGSHNDRLRVRELVRLDELDLDFPSTVGVVVGVGGGGRIKDRYGQCNNHVRGGTSKPTRSQTNIVKCCRTSVGIT